MTNLSNLVELIVLTRFVWLTGDSVGSIAVIRQAAADSTRQTVVSGDELSWVQQHMITHVLKLRHTSTDRTTDCF